MQRMLIPWGVMISALGIMSGCTTSITIPVTELPLLSTQRVNALANWPDVTTTTGEKAVIVGTIKSVSIESLRHDMFIVPPFAAWNRGPVVDVVHRFGRKFIAWGDNPTVVVRYDDLEQSRASLGSFFAGIGMPTFIFGFVWFTLTRKAGENDIETTLITSGLMAAGIGLTVPGLLLAATTPEKPHLSARSSVPKLMIAKNTVGVALAF